MAGRVGERVSAGGSAGGGRTGSATARGASADAAADGWYGWENLLVDWRETSGGGLGGSSAATGGGDSARGASSCGASGSLGGLVVTAFWVIVRTRLRAPCPRRGVTVKSLPLHTLHTCGMGLSAAGRCSTANAPRVASLLVATSQFQVSGVSALVVTARGMCSSCARAVRRTSCVQGLRHSLRPSLASASVPPWAPPAWRPVAWRRPLSKGGGQAPAARRE